MSEQSSKVTRPRSAHVTRQVRADAPEIAYGDHVWWNGELYVTEAVELHGGTWKLCLVEPKDFQSPRARAHFVSAYEVEPA